jgi:hypothetical protein
VENRQIIIVVDFEETPGKVVTGTGTGTREREGKGKGGGEGGREEEEEERMISSVCMFLF